MKKSIIVMATLAALSGFAHAATTTLGAVEWIPGATDSTSWEGSATDKLVFDGTYKDQSGKPALGSDKKDWKNAGLFIQGTLDEVQVSSIKGGTLEFVSKNAETNNPSSTPGIGFAAVVLGGNSTLTIDVGELLVGNRTVDSELNGADRGFRLSGSGNTLNIFADRIVSYTGDEFVHVRDGNGSSVANIGTADRRIGYFEAHTGWGKGDYGVSILQVNEGNTLNFYAENAKFDGSEYVIGGVFGSGGWGNLLVDVSGELTIDGNICGSYGSMVGEKHLNTVFFMDVNASLLSMSGDINAGSRIDATTEREKIKDKWYVKEGVADRTNDDARNSAFDRTTVINVNAGAGSVVDGKVNVYQRGNVALAGDLTIKGGISVEDDGHVLIGGRITTDATVDGSKEFNKFEEYGMGKVTVGGDIVVKEDGTLTVGGILDASNNVITFESAQTQAVLFAAEASAPVAGLTVTEGAKVMAKEIKAASTDATLGAGSELVVNKAQFQTLSGSGSGEAGKVTTNGEVTTKTVDQNVNVVFNAQGASFKTDTKADTATVTASVSSSFAETFTSQQAAAEYANSNATITQGTNTSLADRVEVAETESNGKYTADIGSDGKIDYSTAHQTLNSKTAQVGETIGFNLLSWRLEMNDMNKRLGELRDSEGDTGVWARVNAGKQKYAGSKNNFQQLQFGADTKVDALAGAYVGGAFSYTNSDISYVGGNGDNNIYGLSAYASWLGDTGSFMDVIAKVARLESDSKVFGTSADFDTYAYSISAEVGHRFDIGTVAFVEPQLEVNYGYVDGKGFDTVSSTGVRVGTDVDAVESLVGRVGFRAGFTCPQKKGNAYIHASVLREFDGDMKVSRGDGAYTQDMGDTWFEYGIGGNWNVSPSTQVYADVQRTSGADLSEPWRVNVGARYVF